MIGRETQMNTHRRGWHGYAAVAVAMLSATSVHAQLWQVDFQGNENNNGLFGQTPPVDASGPGTWDIFEVQAINARPSVEGVPSDITAGSLSLPLLDSTGASGSVVLEVESAGGFLSGWAGGSGADALYGDYLLALSPGGDDFFGYPAASSPLDFSITGLAANSSYDVTFIHGNVSNNRGLDFVANGIATSVSTASLESTVRIATDATGAIVGSGSFTGSEGNWAGLRIQDAPDLPPGTVSWQIDFQGEAGGCCGSRVPVTSTFDAGFGSVWNEHTMRVFDGNFDNAEVPAPLTDIDDSFGNSSNVDFAIQNRVLAINSPEIGSDPSTLEAATGDHFFFAQGDPSTGTENPVNFEFSDVPAGTYTLTAYSNPTAHNPPRDFSFTVGEQTATINPTFENGSTIATPSSIIGSIENIVVDDGGVLSGRFDMVPGAGDPSVAAFRLTGVPDPVAPTYTVERVTGGLDRPTYVTQAPGDSNTLYIVEQHVGSETGGSLGAGRIRRFDLATGQLDPTPFVEIGGIDTTIEGGVHTMVFHPDFQTNGKFYVAWLEDGGDGASGPNDFGNVDEYVVVDGEAQHNRTILRYQLRDPRSTHGLNWIGFDPTATGDEREFLHITTGDSGFAGGNINNNFSQDLTNIDGKVLRVDVSGEDDYPADPDKNFGIPDTNPYVSDPNNPDALGEVLHSGLRNPWRASFDRDTGDLYLGDVGLGSREEINFVLSGETGVDFGWNQFEGTLDRGGSSLQPDPRSPIHEYPHPQGFSVTGGYVYRGPIEDLQGHYFFGDFVTADIWSGEFDRDTEPSAFDGTNLVNIEQIDALLESMVDGGAEFNQVVSFGEDNQGNLYIIDFAVTDGGVFNPLFDTGEIFRIVPITPALAGDFNADGVVDAADYAVWRDNLGGDPSALNGNGSGEPEVGSADYLLWRSNFGNSLPGRSAVDETAVPEPGAFAVLSLCAGIWLLGQLVRSRIGSEPL